MIQLSNLNIASLLQNAKDFIEGIDLHTIQTHAERAYSNCTVQKFEERSESVLASMLGGFLLTDSLAGGALAGFYTLTTERPIDRKIVGIASMSFTLIGSTASMLTSGSGLPTSLAPLTSLGITLAAHKVSFLSPTAIELGKASFAGALSYMVIESTANACSSVARSVFSSPYIWGALTLTASLGGLVGIHNEMMTNLLINTHPQDVPNPSTTAADTVDRLANEAWDPERQPTLRQLAAILHTITGAPPSSLAHPAPTISVPNDQEALDALNFAAGRGESAIPLSEEERQRALAEQTAALASLGIEGDPTPQPEPAPVETATTVPQTTPETGPVDLSNDPFLKNYLCAITKDVPDDPVKDPTAPSDTGVIVYNREDINHWLDQGSSWNPAKSPVTRASLRSNQLIALPALKALIQASKRGEATEELQRAAETELGVAPTEFMESGATEAEESIPSPSPTKPSYTPPLKNTPLRKFWTLLQGAPLIGKVLSFFGTLYQKLTSVFFR